LKIPFVSDWLWERNQRKALKIMKEHNELVMKGFADARTMTNHLPRSPEILPYPQSGAGMRSLAFRVPVIRTVIENLATEQFRRLPTLKPRFEAKCPICGGEYQDYVEFCENPLCTIQGIKCYRPDMAQVQVSTEWEKKVNFNGKPQSVHDLAKMFATDAHIQDNPWVTVSYEYITDQFTGEIIAKKPVEFLSARPEVMRLVQDEYGRPGGKYWTCIDHRSVLKGEKNRFDPCPECGKPLHNVTAVSVDLSQPGTSSVKDTIDHPFIDGEWFHDPYYTQTTSYGISNLFTLWTIGSTLSYMDQLENNTFKQGRPPKSMLLFNSYNPESVKSQITDEMTIAHRNRNYTPKLVFPFEGKMPAQTLNLMPNDNELDVLGRRKEIKESIGILYGQSAFMIGDMSTGGGLNNEGMQQTTMLRRVESLNEWIENGFYRFYLDCLGVTDFSYRFPPPKEEDRMAILQRKKENLQMIGEVLNRGGDYLIKNEEDLEFEVIGKMGPLESGMGFKEMGGSGWDPSDWQHQDASFAFSLDTIKKFSVQEFADALKEFIHDIAFFVQIGDTSAYDMAWSQFRDRFLEYLRTMNSRTIRTVLEGDEFEIDPVVLDAITRNPDVITALDELKTDIRMKIEQSISGDVTDTREWVNDIMSIGSMVSSRVENITRTENNAIVNVARAESYRAEDPDDEDYDYYWVGPDYVPGRSTKVCQAIKNEFDRYRAEHGRVSLDAAREIIDTEGGREHDGEKAFNMGREWLPHFNCRHNLVARRYMGKAIVYVDKPSNAPPGTNIIEGPRGGWYYETSGTVNAGSGDELGDEEDDPQTPDSGDDGEGRSDDNSGVEDIPKAIALRDLQDTNLFHIKLYQEEEEEEVKDKMEQAGYQLEPDPGYVEITEAKKDGGVGV
jgi:hypothetical protein